VAAARSAGKSEAMDLPTLARRDGVAIHVN